MASVRRAPAAAGPSPTQSGALRPLLCHPRQHSIQGSMQQHSAQDSVQQHSVQQHSVQGSAACSSTAPLFRTKGTGALPPPRPALSCPSPQLWNSGIAHRHLHSTPQLLAGPAQPTPSPSLPTSQPMVRIAVQGSNVNGANRTPGTECVCVGIIHAERQTVSTNKPARAPHLGELVLQAREL